VSWRTLALTTGLGYKTIARVVKRLGVEGFSAQTTGIGRGIRPGLSCFCPPRQVTPLVAPLVPYPLVVSPCAPPWRRKSRLANVVVNCAAAGAILAELMRNGPED